MSPSRGEAEHFTAKDFEQLSKLSLNELYSRIGWGVSVRLNVVPIDRNVSQQLNPRRAKQFTVPRGIKGADRLRLPKTGAAIVRGKRFLAKLKRALKRKRCV